MSLSGNLSFVPLDEVLRLLNRANQRGMLEVRGEGVDGRVYFDLGGVTLATMLSDDELVSHIRRSETPEGEPMAALLREMAVETIHQLSVRGRSFQVFEGRTPSVAAPAPFDLEELLGDARRRYDEWAEISRVVTDMDALLRLQRDLGERDRVTIDRDSWRLISEIGAGASVKHLARELGTTDFWAARVAAGLISESLLRLDTATTAQPATSSTWVAEPEAPAADQSVEHSEPVAEPEPEPTFETAGASEEPAYAVEATYAEEPASEPEPVFADERVADAEPEPAEPEPEPEPVAAAEEPKVDPNVSWWVEPEEPAPAAEEEQVAEDTEAFLEKVFSGVGEDSQSRQEEGFGLLRRRRLGLRDMSNEG